MSSCCIKQEKGVQEFFELYVKLLLLTCASYLDKIIFSGRQEQAGVDMEKNCPALPCGNPVVSSVWKWGSSALENATDWKALV